MKIFLSENADRLGTNAGTAAAGAINRAIAEKGEARIILSTGASQFETLRTLTEAKVDWKRVTMFHLDEYVGIPETHIASFRKYLRERFVEKIDLGAYVFVDGNPDNIPALTEKLTEKDIDLGIVGIGVNGHIAFNDPPADFETKESYIVVNLDETCRMQQVGEGWFDGIDSVPSQAISMTPYRIMQCKKIITAVPHSVKADAIKKTLSSDISPLVPATLLKLHSDWELYIDRDSASLLSEEDINKFGIIRK